MSSSSAVPSAPAHFNNTGCEIRIIEGKGRGVFATRTIPAQTLIEISPVLLFTKEEYAEHGRHTILDHYTFVWRDGRMALALGLGSLFNHSASPNVSFSLDPSTESIRYTTARTVHPGEELNIFYGHKLWFDPVGTSAPQPSIEQESEDGWGGLSAMDDTDSDFRQNGTLINSNEDAVWSSLIDRWDANLDTIIAEADLPFTRIKIMPDDPEEEAPEMVQTVQAWVVDLPDPKQTASMLKWIQRARLGATFSHLKRIRKNPSTNTTSLLLTPCTIGTGPTATPVPAPSLPEEFGKLVPYETAVPALPALTPGSLKAKLTIWPTVYSPRQKGKPEPWTAGRVRWAAEAIRELAQAARDAEGKGELPVVAYVPLPYEEAERAQLSVPFVAHDTRKSADHPLRHAVLNVVRKLAEYRAASNTTSSVIEEDVAAAAARVNGSHYLLTSLTLFITHEPCIMCSMALLHSRVREVIYLVPAPRTGGCGGVTCVPRMPGVNHRFNIAKWRLEGHWLDWWTMHGVQIDEDVDA